MELYTGQTQNIYLDIYVEDEVRLADVNPTVTIYDGETDVLLTSGYALPEDNDEGKYEFRIIDNHLLTDKLIKAVWTYSVDGNAMSSINYYNVVTPYISLAEVYTKLHIGRNEGEANYIKFHEVAEAERFARFMVQNYTGADFGKKEKNVSAYGQDADVLFLGERIISYTVIKENNKVVIDKTNNINLFSHAVEVTDTNYSLRIISDDDINEGGKKDIVYPSTGSFYGGYRYDVTGVFGYKSVPEKVQAAVMMLMKDYFGKDNIWRARYVNSVSFGDTDMQFSKLAFRGTGNFYVDKLLDEYKSTNMAVI